LHIAFVTQHGRGLIDDCLSEAVALMAAAGLRLAGTVRALPVDHHAHPCDMDLQVLPDGPMVRISQALGSGARGCRLDPGAIATLACAVEARLAQSDLLVINKFGKQEALGRGLRPVIGAAMMQGVPVLVGVNGQNLPAFLDFASGMATEIAPDPRSILAWARQVVPRDPVRAAAAPALLADGACPLQ
jgi:hypothetical protein